MMERREIAVYDGSNRTDPPPPVSARNAPKIVKCVGQAAEFAWEEFFQGELVNPHTRVCHSSRNPICVNSASCLSGG
jgi:hypothetical protein